MLHLIAVMQVVSMSGATRLSLSQQPPQANVKHLIRQFDPHCASHPPGQLPPAKWMDVPFDIMREVVQRLAVHDVQTTLLVCREWHDGFSNGVVSLKPRLLRLEELAYRLDTCAFSCSSVKGLYLHHGRHDRGPNSKCLCSSQMKNAGRGEAVNSSGACQMLVMTLVITSVAPAMQSIMPAH